MSGPRRSLSALAASALAASLFACGGKASAPVPASQGWWRDKVVYEIFTRSLADGAGADGVGDLPGVTARLPDLADLGIDAIWLTPIHPSPSYHGYDVTDYRSVRAEYGSMADFDALVQEAHRRGIRVILDMVLNHSSSQHPWFVNSRTGDAAQYRSWYDWSATDPGWRRPWDNAAVWYQGGTAYYYGIFCPCMPDLNLGNPAVEQELTDSMKLWLSHGADGFRLDAVRYFFESQSGALADQPETHAFLRRLRSNLPGTLLVAEAWANQTIASTYYGAGDEVQLAFAFDLADALKSSIRDGASGAFVNELVHAQTSLQGKDLGFLAPFLSNHDMPRALRAMGGDPAQARVAAAALLALPGTPFLYYGEEIGMQGGAGTDDRDKRTAMRWSPTGPGYGFSTTSPWWSAAEAAGVDVESQRADAQSLRSEYKRLLALRKAQPALNSGDMALAQVSGGGAGAVALLRTSGAKRVLFVANLATTASGAFSIAATGTPAVLDSEGLSGTPSSSGGSVAVAGLGPRSFAFLSLN